MIKALLKANRKQAKAARAYGPDGAAQHLRGMALKVKGFGGFRPQGGQLSQTLPG